MPLKNSVYLLPKRADGGEATLCRGSLLAGTTDEELEAMFQTERETDYAAIERGAAVFEGLYAYISSGAPPRSAD